MTRQVGRLVAIEAKLFLREPISLLFVVAFPALVVVILGGVFEPGDPAFGGARPSDYYVAAYIGVVVTAVALVGLPVHLAAYREQGVLRRVRASHLPPWSLPAAWVLVGTTLCLVGVAVVLGTAQLIYGVPAVQHPADTALAVAVAIVSNVSLGILLGLRLPTARSAQATGLALFFPSFLLGGGGPPPGAMPGPMRIAANAFPLTHTIRAIQHPWLSVGGPTGLRLALMAGIAVIASAGWVLDSQLRSIDR